MKGTFPIDKFQEIQTPFYYYDTNVLRQTLKTINEEAGKHEGFEVHYAVKAMPTLRCSISSVRLV